MAHMSCCQSPRHELSLQPSLGVIALGISRHVALHPAQVGIQSCMGTSAGSLTIVSAGNSWIPGVLPDSRPSAAEAQGELISLPTVLDVLSGIRM